MNAGPAALAAALSRNVYAGQGGAERLARYVQALEDGLAKASLAELVEGPIFARKPAAIA